MSDVKLLSRAESTEAAVTPVAVPTAAETVIRELERLIGRYSRLAARMGHSDNDRADVLGPAIDALALARRAQKQLDPLFDWPPA